MDDLVQFLRARLDEDEQTAKEVLWEGSGNTVSWSLPASATVEVGTDEFYAGDSTVARHIARHDPARVLAEVDAKRRMVEAHDELVVEGDPFTGCNTCSWRDYMDNLHVRWPCPTLRLMLIPYAGRPGYRAEWAIQPPDPDYD